MATLREDGQSDLVKPSNLLFCGFRSEIKIQIEGQVHAYLSVAVPLVPH